jgi:hypothetical protein
METFLVLATTALSVIAAALLGSRSASSTSLGGWGLALVISVCLSIATFLIANFVIAGCTSLGICRRLTDTDLGLALAPVFAFPLYWLAAGMSAQARRTQRPIPQAADAAAIASALKKFRSGASVSEICPSCTTLLVVKPAKTKPGGDANALRLTCQCGASNGTYVIN